MLMTHDFIWHYLVEVSPLAHVDITTVRPEDWKKVSIKYEHRQGHIQVSMGGGKGPRSPSNSQMNNNKCVFNKRTLKVCVNCS